jgi:phenylacetate-CoA ligase
MIRTETGPIEAGARGHFQARPIDDVPELLEDSYRLRYQVYCLERKFLRAENYPQKLEIDEFDRHSLHVGAVDARGKLAGTARAVRVSEIGLPLFHHCTTFLQETEFHTANTRIVEIGRLAVSRTYARHARDISCGVKNASLPGGFARNRQEDRWRDRKDLLLTLMKAMYQATKRIGATDWLVAMEISLERLLAQHGFSFQLIGPESDYFGLVAPYRLDLKELDKVIASGRFPALDALVVGLEPEFGPQPDGMAVRPDSSCRQPIDSSVRPIDREVIAVAQVPVFGLETEIRLLREFRRAAADVPAYRTLLEEHGVRVDDVRDLASFSRWCPLLSKKNTFSRFPLDQLSIGGALLDVADVLTSSGHGGRFSFGVISRKQALAGARFIDRAFDDAFSVASRKTLAINCLPMGVIFSSHLMTVATTSVREDMAVALVEAFGHHYDQIVLAGDPLFLKRLADHAAERGLDWSRYRVNAIIGEDVFGEHFRGYLAKCLGLSLDKPDLGYIMSSFGVGELGLHLCYETPTTIGLRRASFNNPSFARDLLGIGQDEGIPLPMIFSFDPLRTFIEVVEPDRSGYGRMTTSMLDPERSVPLLRYQTGDIVRVLGHAQVAEVARRHGVTLPDGLPGALLALRGREQEALPNGSHVAFYKDALYADHRTARHLTGAFRVTFSGARCTMHVQLAAAQTPPHALLAFLEQGILEAIPSRVRPEALVLWAYGQFPFGMRLDYERKFSHYAVAAHDEGPNCFEPPILEYAS